MCGNVVSAITKVFFNNKPYAAKTVGGCDIVAPVSNVSVCSNDK